MATNVAEIYEVNQKKELIYKKISAIQSGVAGEYFVAAELSRRGYLCSITLKTPRE